VSVLGKLFGGVIRDGDADDRSLNRYRHLLGNAPVESIEQAHAEAFEGLREQERAAIYEELSRGAGTGERPLSSEPATLARSATRAEHRMPGSLERTLRDADQRGGFEGTLVSPVVQHVAGSPLVSAFLPWNG
jgi:hypothetical protein